MDGWVDDLVMTLNLLTFQLQFFKYLLGVFLYFSKIIFPIDYSLFFYIFYFFIFYLFFFYFF